MGNPVSKIHSSKDRSLSLADLQTLKQLQETSRQMTAHRLTLATQKLDIVEQQLQEVSQLQ